MRRSRITICWLLWGVPFLFSAGKRDTQTYFQIVGSSTSVAFSGGTICVNSSLVYFLVYLTRWMAASPTTPILSCRNDLENDQINRCNVLIHGCEKHTSVRPTSWQIWQVSHFICWFSSLGCFGSVSWLCLKSVELHLVFPFNISDTLCAEDDDLLSGICFDCLIIWEDLLSDDIGSTSIDGGLTTKEADTNCLMVIWLARRCERRPPPIFFAGMRLIKFFPIPFDPV